MGFGTASADEPSSLTLTYACPFPLIGNDTVTVEISANIPATLEVGVPSPEIAIIAISTVGEKATQGLNLVGAKTLTGTAVSQSKITHPGGSLDLAVPVTLEDTAIPASGTFTVDASGTAPSITLNQPGDLTISVHELDMTLTPLDANGSETGLGTFDSHCVLDPADQDNILATGQIVGDGPVDPADPTDPTDPSDPADPADPGDPADPADPSDPADPTDPSDPADPADPGDPADPADPSPADVGGTVSTGGSSSGSSTGGGASTISGGTSSPQLSGGAQLSSGGAGGGLANTGTDLDAGLIAFGAATMLAGGAALRYVPRLLNNRSTGTA
ncbi:DUF6801 domain-containing protein [Streptomyces sp. YIM 98790]|uniref:DUF6801 domain-containing protein n=1 Tax=Streptomyces sp. YIM 98790 TaxID=2689077 RepID=UPI001FB79911|nr:DUF6801 domain-containing protein [Streptomyces sp. YIM 98790]